MKSWIFDFSTHFTKKTTAKQIFLSKYLCKSKLFPNPKILGVFLAFFFNNWTFLHIFAHCYEFSEILGRLFNFQTWVMVRTFPFGVELYTWLGKFFADFVVVSLVVLDFDFRNWFLNKYWKESNIYLRQYVQFQLQYHRHHYHLLIRFVVEFEHFCWVCWLHYKGRKKRH